MAKTGDTKTVRTFECRDYLYRAFDQLSSELNCSMDFLINEAMREYARTRDVALVQAAAPPAEAAREATIQTEVEQDIEPLRDEDIASMSLDMDDASVESVTTGRPPPRRSEPPPLPVADAKPVLKVTFNGETHVVDKDEYIIGRGGRLADLAIRDGNISRRHAAVVFHAGAYYIKDLGSTNGVTYEGRRVESKRIEEGDVYHLCDHVLSFSYK